MGAILLEKMHKGKLTTLDSAAAFPSDPDVLRVKCVGSALEVWYNPAGTPGAATLSATDGDIGWGGVALSGWDALFDNLKVGYDADDDDDLDGSDDVVIDEDFSSTSVSPTHDDAGNLTKDADYAYVYDAWNNLVKVRAQNDADVVVGVYAYYADNRRASKTVTNRGDLDGATYFFYDGLREIEERNGSEQVTQQYVWGHEYIDQLLMIRGANGTWFVHQDANWNVIALTSPNGDVAEEVQYQPYGLPQVRRHLAFGDSDADGDVDASDSTARTAALSTYNRAFDADFDGDVSNTSGDADKEAWDASYNDPAASTTMVVANRGFSPSGNPFLFTGRRLDAETGLYFYRFRTYHPTLKTFLQRDPLGYVDSASLYQYVGGKPTAVGDPLGLMTCAEILNKINNLIRSIKRRTDDLKNDPLGLPGKTDNDHLKPSESRRGHMYLIIRDKIILSAYRAAYNAFCRPPDQGPEVGPGVTIPNEGHVPVKLPKPRTKPFPPTTQGAEPVVFIPLPTTTGGATRPGGLPARVPGQTGGCVRIPVLRPGLGLVWTVMCPVYVDPTIDPNWGTPKSREECREMDDWEYNEYCKSKIFGGC